MRSADPSTADIFHFETELHSKGIRLIAGVDEAGRGPLAGPVVAAAVILPYGIEIAGLADSKRLTAKRRESLFDEIRDKALSFGIGSIDPEGIDRMNILNASLEAMRMAVDELEHEPEYLLIDGPFEIDHSISQWAITRGDSISPSIQAASIIAKVTRDRIMCEMENLYPGFSFSSHKGYGTARHYEELSIYGPTPIHRRSFLDR